MPISASVICGEGGGPRVRVNKSVKWYFFVASNCILFCFVCRHLTEVKRNLKTISTFMKMDLFLLKNLDQKETATNYRLGKSPVWNCQYIFQVQYFSLQYRTRR